MKNRGLAEVFSDVPHDKIGGQELAGRGPGDLSGSVIAYQTHKGEPPRRLGYYAAEQRWYPVGDGSLCWIGIDTAEPPTAHDLRRRKTHGGYVLETDCGEFTIPIIRRPDGSTGLPTDMYLDAAGQLCEPIKSAYEKYWEDAQEPVRWFFGQTEEDSIDTMRALQLAVDALSLNYRFTMQEQSVLRIIDKENYLTILLYSIDYPRVRQEAEAQKKT